MDAVRVAGNVYCWSDGARFALGIITPSCKPTVVRWGAWPAHLLQAEEPEMPDEPEREELTAREIETMWQIVMGRSNKEISTALDLSEHTVKFHVRNAVNKLGGRRESAAVVFALMPKNIKRARAIFAR